jgi:hypothetical protein
MENSMKKKITHNDIEIYKSEPDIYLAIFPEYDGYGGQLYADYELSGDHFHDVNLHDYISDEEKKYLRTFPKVEFDSLPERVKAMVNQDLKELNKEE